MSNIYITKVIHDNIKISGIDKKFCIPVAHHEYLYVLTLYEKYLYIGWPCHNAACASDKTSMKFSRKDKSQFPICITYVQLFYLLIFSGYKSE